MPKIADILNISRWAELRDNPSTPRPFHLIYSNVLRFASFHLSHATLPPLDPWDPKHYLENKIMATSPKFRCLNQHIWHRFKRVKSPKLHIFMPLGGKPNFWNHFDKNPKFIFNALKKCGFFHNIIMRIWGTLIFDNLGIIPLRKKFLWCCHFIVNY